MNDYLLEKRLRTQAPDLHRRVTDSEVILQRMLESFLSWFPDFTDHSILHSLDVLDYCNRLIGPEQVDRLCPEECYVLIMSCYLHDTGMGIQRADYDEFSREIDFGSYLTDHPDAFEADVIRTFHHEFSGLFIRKYADLFDIPTPEMLFAIVQISRGHRKTNLYDTAEYPDIPVQNGVIRTPFLSAVLRLADEIDVGADRNPELLFDTSKLTKLRDIYAFGTHESIKNVEVAPEQIILHAKPKTPEYIPLIQDLRAKIQQTLDECRDVAEKRSEFVISQKETVIDWLSD